MLWLSPKGNAFYLATFIRKTIWSLTPILFSHLLVKAHLYPGILILFISKRVTKVNTDIAIWVLIAWYHKHNESHGIAIKWIKSNISQKLSNTELFTTYILLARKHERGKIWRSQKIRQSSGNFLDRWRKIGLLALNAEPGWTHLWCPHTAVSQYIPPFDLWKVAGT